METKNTVIRDPDDEWVAQHSEEFFKKYSGKYLGIVDRKIVIVDKDFGKVFQKVTKEYPRKIPRISIFHR